MHGTRYANYAIGESDLLIAVGVRFDDRVTGKIDTFAPHAKVIHIDIDAAEKMCIRDRKCRANTAGKTGRNPR